MGRERFLRLLDFVSFGDDMPRCSNCLIGILKWCNVKKKIKINLVNLYLPYGRH